MLNLDPSKLLIIAVVAVILLGPDRLPAFARQVGGAWRSFTAYRHRMEQEVRSSMPDLPSSAEIARLARSPSALLDRLSTMSPDEGQPSTTSAANDVFPDGDPSTGGTERQADFVRVSETPVRVPGVASSPPADPGMN
jgi:Sec-independent protein translocase protein TatA